MVETLLPPRATMKTQQSAAGFYRQPALFISAPRVARQLLARAEPEIE
jgi:hypothetical protein